MENESALNLHCELSALKSSIVYVEEENGNCDKELMGSLTHENKGLGLNPHFPENSVMEGELDFEDEVNDAKVDDDVKEDASKDLQKESFTSVDFKVKEVSEADEENQMSGKEDGQLSPEKDDDNDKEVLAEEDKDDGELSDDEDLEEGEVKDNLTAAKQQVRQVCRFFNRGQCTWGNLCRFLHLSVNDRGNYNMFAPNTKSTMLYPLHGNGLPIAQQPIPVHVSQRPGRRSASELNQPQSLLFSPSSVPSEAAPPVESAWERGLRHAKEMVKKATRRKEQEPDFEEKRLNLGIEECHKMVASEYDKENDYYGKTTYRRPNEVAPFSKFEQTPDPFDKGEQEAKEYWRGGQFEDFEVQWPSQDGLKRRREKELTRNAKFPAERNKKVRENKWRDERLSEIQTTRSRADEWRDPWRRSKTPKGRRRSRRRSHHSYSSTSHSYSERSSHSSYSHSRSSSRSSFYSSRRSSSSRSVTITPSRSRSRSYSRSLSMDSVSSASSSISQSSSRSGSTLNQNIVPQNIDDVPTNIEVSKKAEILMSKPGFPHNTDKIYEAVRLLPNATTMELFKMLETQNTNPVNTGPAQATTSANNASLYAKDEVVVKQEPGLEAPHITPSIERAARDAPKPLFPKPQIKLTLLNKELNSRFPYTVKRQPEFKVQSMSGVDASKTGAMKRALSPGNGEMATTKEKKSTSSRRDELLKQLRAVEDAIARKRSKFFE